MARQIPIWEDEKVTGFVDLALERAYLYQPGKPSEIIDIPKDLAERETEARFHMLEQLADFDDELMEKLLSDVTPDRDIVFADLVREMRDGLIVPVFFGSTAQGHGVRRLLKALRHDTPEPKFAAARLGLTGAGAYVMKISHAGQAGKLAYARVFGGALNDSDQITLSDGAAQRPGALFSVQRRADQEGLAQRPKAMLSPSASSIRSRRAICLGASGAAEDQDRAFKKRFPVYQLAIATKDRKDDVRLSGALQKLVEEDAGLDVVHDQTTHEILLQGQGEPHLRVGARSAEERASTSRSPPRRRRRRTRRASARPPKCAAATRSRPAATASSAIA